MIELFDIAFILGLAVLWSKSEYGIYFRRWMGFKEEDYDTYTPTKRFLHRGLYCLYCSSFWVALIMTLNFKTAVVISLLAYIIDKME